MIAPAVSAGLELNDFAQVLDAQAEAVAHKVADIDTSLSNLADDARTSRQGNTNMEAHFPAETESSLAAVSRPQDNALRALTNAVSEVVISNEEAPVPLTEAEAKLDPIKALGQVLKVEASFWSSKDNEIVEGVLKISNKFIDLSRHQKTLSASYGKNAESKKAFIQNAQSIMLDSASFVKAVQPLIDDCTDKRLVAHLVATLGRITTLSQQLKILAAVKASSPLDTDKAVQLITASQNLVNSFKQALRECVSCSVRAKKGSRFNLRGINFRKVVYNSSIKE